MGTSTSFHLVNRVALMLLLLAGCQKPPAAPHAAAKPAKVDKVLTEGELNVVELSEDARRRLKIATATIEERDMPRVRAYGATLLLPTDAAIVVSAPLAGTVRSRPGGRFPGVGESVDADSPLIELLPMLSPERSVLTPSERVRLAEARNTIAQSRIDAAGQLAQAQVQVDAARIALERAERLLREQVGTVRAVDEARAQMQLAEKGAAAAATRVKLLEEIRLDEDAGTLSPVSIPSPMAGIVRTASVKSGELVAAGAPLFEVIDHRRLWVRVPVYVGEARKIDASRAATLTMVDGRVTASAAGSPHEILVEPVKAPPTADPLSATVDLYYALQNPDGEHRPGERLTAHLTLMGETRQRAVPWKAVYHDVYGGQWVYEDLGGRKYARRRIEVGWVDNGWAVLIRGPQPKTAVVTAGVAELAGTEFGFAK